MFRNLEPFHTFKEGNVRMYSARLGLQVSFHCKGAGQSAITHRWGPLRPTPSATGVPSGTHSRRSLPRYKSHQYVCAG